MLERARIVGYSPLTAGIADSLSRLPDATEPEVLAGWFLAIKFEEPDVDCLLSDMVNYFPVCTAPELKLAEARVLNRISFCFSISKCPIRALYDRLGKGYEPWLYSLLCRQEALRLQDVEEWERSIRDSADGGLHLPCFSGLESRAAHKRSRQGE